MEDLVLPAVCLSATAAAWLLVGPADEGDVAAEALGSARARLARKAVAGWLTMLGRAAPVVALERSRSLCEAVRAVAASGLAREWGLGQEASMGLVALGIACAGVAGGILAGPPGVPVGLFACVGALVSWSASLVRVREEELAREVPGAFRSLAGALGSGKTLSQAISYVGSGKGALAREFGRASLRVSCGSSASEALDELAGRVSAPGIGLMVCALAVSARTGSPLHGLFMRSAELAERRFELKRELMAKTAQVRLSARIVCGLPAGLVGALVLLSPDFREGLATPVGLGCVVLAVVLDVAAVITIRQLMRRVM